MTPRKFKTDEPCHKCGEASFKTDSKSRLWCEKCLKKAMNGVPFIAKGKQGRNKPCNCGSGKKFKKCCLNK